MSWLQPLAWWGLAGIAAPILIHMLARHWSRRVLFPSLKFLHTAQVAALRRRVVSDWPLLIVRVLIVALSAAALAGPVFVSEARRASWNRRVARAIVVSPDQAGQAASLADEEARTSIVYARFGTEHLADALLESVEWLRQQPPAAREIVVIGDLREGALTDRDVETLPPFVGLRFLPASGAAASSAEELDLVAEGASGEVSRYTAHLTVEQSSTRVRYEPAPDKRTPDVRLVADASTQAHADAVLRAVWRDGVLLGRHPERRLTIAFRGAPGETVSARTPITPWIRYVFEQNTELAGGEIDGALAARVDTSATDPGVAGIVSRVLRSAFAESLEPLEPRPIGAATLARWSRPPGESPSDAPLADEGDRRWFWAGVLMLLAVEQFVRGRHRSPDARGLSAEPVAAARAGSETDGDARVA